MLLEKKISEVEKIFRSLEKDMTAFQKKSGLSCLHHCSHCCTTKDIHATVLEFLPLAYYLFKENMAEEILEKTEARPDQETCLLFSPFTITRVTPGCLHYNYRGLICRLFGFSANTNKQGQPVLTTCHPLKTKYPEKTNDPANSRLAPQMSKYYARLYALDFKLAVTYYPINEAVRKAIESVIFYFSLKGKRVS